MKNLLLKSLTLCLPLLFFAACQKEDTAVNPAAEEITSRTETVDDFNTPEGRFKKEMDIRVPGSPASGYLLTVSTDNPEISAALSEGSITAELVSTEELNRENTEDVETPSTADTGEENVKEHFLTVKFEKFYRSSDENVKITFSDEILRVLRKFKAQTHIDWSTATIAYEKGSNPKIPRGVSYAYAGKNAFWAYGDGGNVPTKLYVQFAYKANPNYYYSHTTAGGFLSSYKFRSCKWPNNGVNRCRFGYIIVVQDVLKKIFPFKATACISC